MTPKRRKDQQDPQDPQDQQDPQHQRELHVAVLGRRTDSDSRVTLTTLEQFPEHAKLVGFIVAEWTQIEFALANYLSLVAYENSWMIVRMIYAIESSGARLNAITTALALVASYPKTKRLTVPVITDLMADARQLLAMRNKYAHALYGIDEASNQLVIVGTFSGKKETGLPLHDLTHQFERMKAFARRVRALPLAEMQALYEQALR